MSGFVLHPEAVEDLKEIWEYIAVEIWMPRMASWRTFIEQFAASFPFPNRDIVALT